MDVPVFYDGWQGLVRILITAPVVYLSIVVFIRVVGKRSTSQLNNFDWVVTVAMGSITGSGILLKDITVLETLTAVAALLALQWCLTRLVYRFGPVAEWVKPAPRLLVRDGRYLRPAMRGERVTEGEVLAAIREAGVKRLEDVRWVILETDGTMSVGAGESGGGAPNTLGRVRGED